MLDRQDAGDGRRWMRLRCGDCRAEREVIVADDVAERFGADLEAAAEELVRAVERMGLERLADQVETFARALELDLVDAGDFA